MYNFKIPNSVGSSNKKKDPFKPVLLRIWIVSCGPFLALFGMIELGRSFSRVSPPLFISIIGLLYLLDLMAESYKFMRYIFLFVVVLMAIASLVVGIVTVWISPYLAFLYCMIAAALAYKEYEL